MHSAPVAPQQRSLASLSGTDALPCTLASRDADIEPSRLDAKESAESPLLSLSQSPTSNSDTDSPLTTLASWSAHTAAFRPDPCDSRASTASDSRPPGNAATSANAAPFLAENAAPSPVTCGPPRTARPAAAHTEVRLLASSSADCGQLDRFARRFGWKAVVTATGNCQQQPLHCAAAAGYVGATRRLIESGAATDVRDVWGTPLDNAIIHRKLPVVLALLECGADPNLIVSKQRRTPLYLAAREGLMRIVQVLLTAGADLGARTAEGDTALFVAAKLGHTECVRVLMAAGADPRAVCGGGGSPVEVCRTRGHRDTLEVLIEDSVA